MQGGGGVEQDCAAPPLCVCKYSPVYVRMYVFLYMYQLALYIFLYMCALHVGGCSAD